MDASVFAKWSSQIEELMAGNLERLVREALGELIEAGEFELLSHLMLTGPEFTARRMTDALIKVGRFEPLIAGACLRREIRRGGQHAGGALGSKAIFRDFEAPEAGEPGVPEHIMEEAEAIASHANQARRIAAQREAQLDRDPVRQHIVDRLGELLNTSEDAMEAVIAIARTSVFEETARSAGMKLGNNKIVMGRISRAGRVADMVAVGDASGSQAVKTIIARSLASAMPESSDPSYRAALEYVADHHPQEAVQRAARKALGR
ncbi:MAG: hypothetical protein GX131_11080 [candidate division WS1 bacterium]|jgi:hypothetical protein|nr:hypothetical protein [candidate division WS1 bacterium]